MCQITVLIFEPVLQNDNLLVNVVLQSKLAQETLKAPYNFDFLTMREDYDERDLEDELTKHITQLLLELIKGFSFCGRQSLWCQEHLIGLICFFTIFALNAMWL